MNQVEVSGRLAAMSARPSSALTGLASACRWLLVGLLLLTVVQQVPPVRGPAYGTIRSSLYVAFAILVLVSLVAGGRPFRRSRVARILGGNLLYLAAALCLVAIVAGHVSFGVPASLLAPLGILVVSAGFSFSTRQLLGTLISYVVAVALMGLWTTVADNGGFMIQSQYLVQAKNQVGPMIALAAVTAAYLSASAAPPAVTPGNNAVSRGLSGPVRWLLGGVTVLLLATLVAVQNRSGMIAACFVLLLVLAEATWTLQGGARMAVLVFVAVGTAAAFFLGYLSTAFEYVSSGFIANRDVHDANSLSSGRVERLGVGWDFFLQNTLFGKLATGESVGVPHAFALNLLVELGLVVGLPLLLTYLWLWRNAIAVSLHTTNRAGGFSATRLAGLLLLCSLITSLFEYSPPFGPGVTQALVWFMIGQSSGCPRSGRSGRPMAAHGAAVR